jgi:hypothetical protein
MQIKTLLLITLLLFTVYILLPPKRLQEPTIEKFTPDPGFSSTVTVVTPDQLDKIIRLTQAALSKQIGKCTYCIETTNISLSGDTYSGRFLFSVLTGFPYGISVDSTVKKGSSGEPETVTNITLQSTKTIDEMDSFKQFKSGSDIEGSPFPALADLQSALNNL